MMTNEEYKDEFQALKNALYDNHVVFHERVTLLVKLTQFDIEDTRVNFKAVIVKPLNLAKALDSNLYHWMMSKEFISFGAAYSWGENDPTKLLNNKKLGRPYCPFTVWFEPELSKFVLENDDEITRKIPNYLFRSADWRELMSP